MIITVANHKGGTGKTTTVHNTGYFLGQAGYRVLLVDLDPQCNLSYSMQFTHIQNSTHNLIQNNKDLAQGIIHAGMVDILPGSFQHELPDYTSLQNYYFQLLKLNPFKKLAENYDFILIDTPPTNSHYLKIALCCSDEILIPMQPDVLSVEGVYQLSALIDQLKNETGLALHVLGVLGINVIESRNLSKEILHYVSNLFSYHVFNNYIRASVKVAEAPSHGKCVGQYAPKTTSSIDYKAFVNEMTLLLETKPQPAYAC